MIEIRQHSGLVALKLFRFKLALGTNNEVLLVIGIGGEKPWCTLCKTWST